MNCPKCNAPLSAIRSRCENCGEDVRIFKKAAKASNLLYNQGLAKAKVRDLSGAVLVLRKSLQFNKRNTNARNLLGLVFFEMGETVSALTEWVVSKHFENEENDADEYIQSIQQNATKLDTLNQAIKKYNTALLSAQQGSDDLAIIQLKKVVSINPKFIRAHQLLALLYLQSNEKDKARKALLKAAKIDVNNTTTLQYLKELGEASVVEQEVLEKSRNVPLKGKYSADPNAAIVPVTTYKEDKPNVLAFINLIIGVVIGIAVVYWLLVPNIKKLQIDKFNNELIEYRQNESAQVTTIAALEDEKKELEEKVEDLKKELESIEVLEIDEAMYDDLFEAASLYLENKKTEAAEVLLKVDLKKVTRPKAIELYDVMKNDTFAAVSTDVYSKGHQQYTARQYQEAIKSFEKALDLDPANVNAIYFMGRAYHQIGENEKAAQYYQEVIDDYPDSNRAREARGKIGQVR